MTPIAIAIPESATTLASTPAYRITMKVIKTPTGKSPEMMMEALRFSTKINTTIILIRISWDSAFSKVPMVSWINWVRS